MRTSPLHRAARLLGPATSRHSRFPAQALPHSRPGSPSLVAIPQRRSSPSRLPPCALTARSLILVFLGVGVSPRLHSRVAPPHLPRRRACSDASCADSSGVDPPSAAATNAPFAHTGRRANSSLDRPMEAASIATVDSVEIEPCARASAQPRALCDCGCHVVPDDSYFPAFARLSPSSLPLRSRPLSRVSTLPFDFRRKSLQPRLLRRRPCPVSLSPPTLSLVPCHDSPPHLDFPTFPATPSSPATALSGIPVSPHPLSRPRSHPPSSLTPGKRSPHCAAILTVLPPIFPGDTHPSGSDAPSPAAPRSLPHGEHRAIPTSGAC